MQTNSFDHKDMQIPGSLCRIGTGIWGHPARQDEVRNEGEIYQLTSLPVIQEFAVGYLKKLACWQ